ncbi:hypothetical protein [Kitasatospora sp. NPDC088134]|uniref:hypothetical protein n=1 Tax=Kitasatospora sp. NPDC088134 TaxID=3364071 RepID=UPI0037F38AC8
MEMISGTGLEGRPWPELLSDGRPALIVPATPDRQALAEEGWAGRGTADLDTGPHPGWSATLTDAHLTVHRPGGAVWFDGEVGADRHWRRRVRDCHVLLLVTGDFTSVFDLRPAAETGQLFLLTVPARLLCDL